MGILPYRPFTPTSYCKIIWSTRANGSTIPGKAYRVISPMAILGMPVPSNHGCPHLKKPDFNYTNYRK